MNNYNNEIKEKWENTNSYQEYLEKTKVYSSSKWDEINNGLMNIFKEFSNLLKNQYSINSNEVQDLVVKLQSYISNNYYTCSDEILIGLSTMYVEDIRFKQNIDTYFNGTAQFVSDAIKLKMKNKFKN